MQLQLRIEAQSQRSDPRHKQKIEKFINQLVRIPTSAISLQFPHTTLLPHRGRIEQFWSSVRGGQGRLRQGVESGNEENEAIIRDEGDVQGENHSEKVNKLCHELTHPPRQN